MGLLAQLDKNTIKIMENLKIDPCPNGTPSKLANDFY